MGNEIIETAPSPFFVSTFVFKVGASFMYLAFDNCKAILQEGLIGKNAWLA